MILSGYQLEWWPGDGPTCSEQQCGKLPPLLHHVLPGYNSSHIEITIFIISRSHEWVSKLHYINLHDNAWNVSSSGTQSGKCSVFPKKFNPAKRLMWRQKNWRWATPSLAMMAISRQQCARLLKVCYFQRFPILKRDVVGNESPEHLQMKKLYAPDVGVLVWLISVIVICGTFINTFKTWPRCDIEGEMHKMWVFIKDSK